MLNPASDIPDVVKQRIEMTMSKGKRVVVMTCGLSGSGKSTLALDILARYPNFVRLSIDSIILATHGTWSRADTSSGYAEYQKQAEASLLEKLQALLREAIKDVVLDLSFYSREMRDHYRNVVKDEGKGAYEVILLVMRIPESSLWERIEERNKEFEGGGDREGIPVSKELLDAWIKGFEWPNDEGEMLVDAN